jgi:hypothetical protein
LHTPPKEGTSQEAEAGVRQLANVMNWRKIATALNDKASKHVKLISSIIVGDVG